MYNAYGVDYHVTFSIKVYCCEQDLNLRRENLLDFKTNTFIARPSQELEGQEGSWEAETVPSLKGSHFNPVQ